MASLNKTEYILRSLAKITSKRWEFYVIAGVIHRLDDLDIEFKCQQLVRVRKTGSWALVDLFFPQFGIYLEVDEPHHMRSLSDEQRQREIFEISDLQEHRISVYGTDGSWRPLDQIHSEIESFVALIKAAKSAALASGSFSPWDFEHQYSPVQHIEVGRIDLKLGGARFRHQRDALACFGYQGGHRQRGSWPYKSMKSTSVWFPKLFPAGDWQNSLSPDGNVITEVCVSDRKEGFRKSTTSEKFRIVFAHEADALGITLYNFKGIFERDDGASSVEHGVIYRRTSESIVLPPVADQRTTD